MKTDYILYRVEDSIATITLNRADAANAQNPDFLDDLDEAWTAAAEDPEVKVILLNANGKHFSSGHDLKGGGGSDAGKFTVQSLVEYECKRYLGYSLKWRNTPKPSIAAVQGVCIAGGLLLAWPCDLIVAADNAKFSDPVVSMGIAGVEFHGHTWELGARLAKEILFTGRAIDAHEAKAVGMVNQVVPLEELQTAARELAKSIAKKDAFALRMAKRAVNNTLDIQGFTNAVQAVFDIHELCHGNAITVCGYPILVDLEAMKKEIGAKG